MTVISYYPMGARRTQSLAHGRTRGPHDRNLLPPCISQYSCPFIPTLGIVVVSAWTLRSAMQRREAIRSCNGRRFLWYGARSGLAYSQWRTTREEVSLDKFYDRLDRTNNVVQVCPSARI
jgi:hypothetical protein